MLRAKDRGTIVRFALPILASVAIVTVGLWISRESGDSEQVITDQPNVEGRLFWGSVGTLTDGSEYIARCEADAHVRVERDTIIDIIEHGDRPEIKIGEKIDRDLSHDPTLTEEDIKERGEPPVFYAVWVYRDQEGVIRTGCSPESELIIDGVSKPYQQWEAEGKIPTPAPAVP